MDSTRRAAGLGLLGYGIATSVAFMSIGAPGGDYEDQAVVAYLSSGHWAIAMALAYLGAFAALGPLVFAHQARRDLPSGGDAVWGLTLAGTAAGVIGWFLIGGISVSFAEGGAPLSGLPHPVVYLVSEMSNLIAVCASSFFLGAAALVLAAQATMPRWLRVFTYVGGACGLLAAFFFPLFIFWVWTIVFGLREVLTAGRRSVAATAQANAVHAGGGTYLA